MSWRLLLLVSTGYEDASAGSFSAALKSSGLKYHVLWPHAGWLWLYRGCFRSSTESLSTSGMAVGIRCGATELRTLLTAFVFVPKILVFRALGIQFML